MSFSSNCFSHPSLVLNCLCGCYVKMLISFNCLFLCFAQGTELAGVIHGTGASEADYAAVMSVKALVHFRTTPPGGLPTSTTPTATIPTSHSATNLATTEATTTTAAAVSRQAATSSSATTTTAAATATASAVAPATDEAALSPDVLALLNGLNDPLPACTTINRCPPPSRNPITPLPPPITPLPPPPITPLPPPPPSRNPSLSSSCNPYLIRTYLLSHPLTPATPPHYPFTNVWMALLLFPIILSHPLSPPSRNPLPASTPFHSLPPPSPPPPSVCG